MAKLTANMVKALESATYSASREGIAYSDADAIHTGWTMYGVNANTLRAMVKRGLCMGDGGLTATGVSERDVIMSAIVDAAECEPIVSDDVAETSTMIAETLSGVVITGDEPNTWAPDFDASGASECYFGCGVSPVAVFVDYVGRTEGVCASHRDRVEGKTYDVPATAHTGTEDVPAHVIIPGVHALDMGAGAYNRFVGIGESAGVPGSLFTYGLATAISAHPGMGGTGKINRECEFGDVITVRTSLGDVRYVVADNRYGTDGPRKGDPLLYPYALEDAKCYVCQVHGDNAAPGKNISGEWICGFCLAFDVTPEKLNSHALSFYVETERMGVKFECDQCGAIDSRHGFGRIMCEGVSRDVPELTVFDLVPTNKIAALAAHIVETQHNVNTCDAFECERCAGVLYARCQESHTGDAECVACAAYERFGFLVIYRGTDAFESDDTDGGFVETLVTKEYELSVIVDDVTGTRVSLGWVTLTMNAAQCMDFDRVAEEYGRTQNTRTPRHGWASIITVHDVADQF
jgi:hypothetical protein